MLKKYGLMALSVLFTAQVFANAADEKALFGLLMPQQTLSAHFTSEVKNERQEVVQKTSGQFYLKRPEKFRWETRVPEHTLVIADGKKIWNYDEGLAQVTVSSLAQSQKTPAILLSGSQEAIQALFAIEKQTCAKEMCFLLKPKQTESELEWLRMRFSGNLLRALLFKDKLGFETQILFTQNQTNPTLKDHLFQFTPPKGVDVVGMPGRQK